MSRRISSCQRSSLTHSLFLFLSPTWNRNVAHRFPHLLSSLIVRSFHTSRPGELSWKWHQGRNETLWTRMTSQYEACHRSLTLFASFFVLQLLRNLGAMDPGLQRFILHNIQPLILGALFLLGVTLSKYPISFAGIGLLIVMGSAYAIFIFHKKDLGQSQRVLPHAISHVDSPDAPIIVTELSSSSPPPLTTLRRSAISTILEHEPPTQLNRRGGLQLQDFPHSCPPEELQQLHWSDSTSSTEGGRVEIQQRRGGLTPSEIQELIRREGDSNDSDGIWKILEELMSDSCSSISDISSISSSESDSD
jgi:hypothetical protein